MPSLLRFLRAFRRPAGAPVTATETTYRRDGETLPATLVRPAGVTRPLPGWVVLHGLTATGRSHESLVRLTRAIASSGFSVLVPEIPEWRELRVAPYLTIPTIQAAVLSLDELGGTQHGRIGLLGFSFGATQGLIAAADPVLHGHLAAVVAWGGYSDLHRAFRFGFSGDHELDGTAYHASPDPYGAWIMGANYLTSIPEHASETAVAAALHELALEAGRRGIFAGDPVFDRSKRRLAARFAGESRELFDLFAPATTAVRDRQAADEMARRLADAALTRDPILDPRPYLHRLDTPTLVAHGRGDRLVPFTESLRLAREMPPAALERCTITGLYAHSGGDRHSGGLLARGIEIARFLRLLNGILSML